MAACNANVRKTLLRTKFEERCGFTAYVKHKKLQGSSCCSAVLRFLAIQCNRGAAASDCGRKEPLLYVSVLDAMRAAAEDARRLTATDETGPQEETRFVQPDPACSNGVPSLGTAITPNEATFQAVS